MQVWEVDFTDRDELGTRAEKGVNGAVMVLPS